MQASIIRDADNIVKNLDSGSCHLMILCVWQNGAHALIQQYRSLEGSLAKGSNLEVVVLTKDELMKRFNVREGSDTTTDQINTLCETISKQVRDKEVHLYIDECWVTVRRKFSAHTTKVKLLLFVS
jgi:hypothetical protein